MVKADKSTVAVGDVLDFKVIEFNKDAKRILLSHLRTWEAPKEEEKPAKKAKKAAAEQPTAPQIEKTTFGDIEALAALKAQLEGK